MIIFTGLYFRFSAVIDAYSQMAADDVIEKVQQVYQTMLLNDGWKLDSVSYGIVINTFLKFDRHDLAEAVLKDMKASGLEATVPVWTMFLQYHNRIQDKQGVISMADKLFTSKLDATS